MTGARNDDRAGPTRPRSPDQHDRKAPTDTMTKPRPTPPRSPDTMIMMTTTDAPRTGSPCQCSPICLSGSLSFLPDHLLSPPSMNTRSSAQKRNGIGPIGLDEVARDELLSPVRPIQHGFLDSPSMNTRSSAQKRRGDDHAFTETSDEDATIKYPNQKSRKHMNEDELLLLLVE